MNEATTTLTRAARVLSALDQPEGLQLELPRVLRPVALVVLLAHLSCSMSAISASAMEYVFQGQGHAPAAGAAHAVRTARTHEPDGHAPARCLSCGAEVGSARAARPAGAMTGGCQVVCSRRPCQAYPDTPDRMAGVSGYGARCAPEIRLGVTQTPTPCLLGNSCSSERAS